ncbi:MAG TPA: DUF5916 domain-containing protein, partial [Kofleriaceae bacterium]|nr:DUF5916 domain-containing protein [Kofleriaceae bacterium]
RVRLDMEIEGNRDWIADSIQVGVGAGATIEARSNIEIFVGPSWIERTDPMQYVAQATDDAGRAHYVFARIHQTTVALTTRVNWTFSPRLSLQAYAQPFIAAGRYSELKDVETPDAHRFADRFHVLSGSEYAIDSGTVRVTHDGTYSFERPDFNFDELRSTVVLRWEYRPGSTIFAIWSHGRANAVGDGRFDLINDVANIGDAPGEHTVMVKANYWMGL